MSFEKFFNEQPRESSAPKKEPEYKIIHGVKYEVKTKRDKPEPEMNRRGFLKAALGLGGAVLAGTAAVKSLEKTAEFTGKLFEEKPESKDREEELSEPTIEQVEIEKEDSATTAEILDFKKDGPIKFDLETAELIKNGWKKKYSENPKLKNDFVRAYREMGCWRPYLEEIFTREGVLKEDIYLAIPESNFKMNAVSAAGAVGPYQFTRATAKLYGLKMKKNFDERKDPLVSGLACAKLLGDLYGRTKDWNLALSGYNGGFLWKYLKEAGPAKKASYADYLKFVEKILNEKKSEIKNLDMTEELREKLYLKEIRGYSENVNYPAKFLAIKELINEKFVTEQEKPVVFREKKIIQPKIRRESYKIAKGDTLSALGRRFKTDPNDIALLNPQVKRGLKIGQGIKLPGKTRLLLLNDVARQTGRSLERLMFLNPAVKVDAPLSESRIRI